MTVEEVLKIHDALIARFGGRPGMIDRGLLESAVASPMAGTADGLYFCADIYSMAARYMIGIARNHCFKDANKRTAAAAGTLFLKVNGLVLLMSQDDLYDLTQDVVAGTADIKSVSAVLASRSMRRE